MHVDWDNLKDDIDETRNEYFVMACCIFSLIKQIKGYYFTKIFTKNDYRMMLVSVVKNVAE